MRAIPEAAIRRYNHLTTFMFAKLVTFFHPGRMFTFLVAFRWAALIPAMLTLGTSSTQLLSPILILSVALLANLFISLVNRQLNRLVLDQPAFLGIDLLFCATLLAMSGSSHSPYYLYALSPLLAGAFFFQIRGALSASTVFTPLYLIGNYLNSQLTLTQADIILVTSQLAGIWLIPILFAFPSVLLKDINQAREELATAQEELAQKHENLKNAHRQLGIIHDLTLLLQSAPDLLSVQERVLGAVTADLGFSKAVVSLVDPAYGELGGWLVFPQDPTLPSTKAIPLKPENGDLIQALLNRTVFSSNSGMLICDESLDTWLRQSRWLVVPLYLREHPVGLLLVEALDEISKERENILLTVANQAALALGTTILCIDRARRLAVETERNRIARDIHDTVAQSLFGIVYSLDACITMLPQKADEVRTELVELRMLANNAHEEVRRSIFDLWPSALTMESFMTDLKNYVGSCCRPNTFSIIFNNSGDFNALPAGLRRTIYRMAQEALANSARHSGAQSARLCVNVGADQVHISVTDEGRGFDPSLALARSINREHFGLHGIRERALAMGGSCEIVSQLNAGARIMMELPIRGRPQNV
jgi:signal transduction histidine kinase